MDDNRTPHLVFLDWITFLLFLIVILLAIPYLRSLFGTGSKARAAEEAGPPHAVLLAINDVYRMDGVGTRKTGGFPKLKTVIDSIEEDNPDLMVLLAGDFLSPSFLSRLYQGEQMIGLMNMLDDDPYGFDERFIVTFGNHEFDDNSCENAAPLLARVAESQFLWVNSNLNLDNCVSLMGLAARPGKVRESVIINNGGINIGVFGIGMSQSDTGSKTYPKEEDFMAVAQRLSGQLKSDGADVVIALTHLLKEDDRKILEQSNNVDFIIGGHDHTAMIDYVNGKWLFKSDSDAKTVRRIDITLDEKGEPVLTSDLIHLDNTIAAETRMQDAANVWLEKHHHEFCASQNPPEQYPCLDEILGTTTTVLEGDEIANRERETGLGDWVADLYRDYMNADVAIINSGALRLNYDIDPYTEITRRHIEELIQYDSQIVSYEVTGEILDRVVRYALGKRESGAWSHFSNIGIKLSEADSNQAAGIFIKDSGGTGWQELDKAKTYNVASLAFVLCGGDGHPFGIVDNYRDRDTCEDDLNTAHTRYPRDPGQNIMIKTLIKQTIMQAPNGEIAPKVQNNICKADADKCVWE